MKHRPRVLGGIHVTLLCALLCVIALQPARSALAAAPRYVEGEVVVQINPASGATIATINAAYRTTTIAALTPELAIYLLRTPPGVSTAQIVDQMALDTRLLFAEPNFISEAPEGDPRGIGAWAGTDPSPYVGQTARDLLGLPQAQQISRGAGIVVAVLDTGVQLDHPALRNRLAAARYDFIDGDTTPADAGNGADDDQDGTPDEMVGHGTHVAGIVLLVAPDARIMPLRVLDSDGHGDFFRVAAAIDYAVDHGAQVINLSLGAADESDAIEDAVRRASKRGVMVVAAAGNLNTNARQYPAGANCALPVTSVGANDVKSAFSNYGSWIDVSAPGETIYSAFPPSGYASWSGTSMATPFVAGQAALIRARAPGANPRSIATLIGTTARPIDGANPSFDGELGAGRIDVGASLSELAQHGLPPSGGGIMGSSCVALDTGDVRDRDFMPMIAR